MHTLRLSHNIARNYFRRFNSREAYANKFKEQTEKVFKSPSLTDELIKKYRDKLVYNTVINPRTPISWKKSVAIKRETAALQESLRTVQPLPVFLKYVDDLKLTDTNESDAVKTQTTTSQVHFPYGESRNTTVGYYDDSLKNVDNDVEDIVEATQKEIDLRMTNSKNVDYSRWMYDYENYDDRDQDAVNNESWKINYGTPDPNFNISNVPCGGCGALLHCQNSSLPGYIPSEIFKNSFAKEGCHLQEIVCQRCHFLKNYNIALQVQISQNDYPLVLNTLKSKTALVILMVDLLDFPCSIWPGILDVLGSKKPVVIVGNKVDLIPRDSTRYLDNIKNVLKDTIKKSLTTEVASLNIKHIELISAKTGYGVESLITKLHNIWSNKGDIYLVGCTNVGKSTLFNSLLQSDFCKIQAVDLVQRATTSLWPGTTLNLLKFPILRPTGWRLYVRTKRLQSAQKLRHYEKKLLNNLETQTPSIVDMVDRTFLPEQNINEDDEFGFCGRKSNDSPKRIGINEKLPEYVASKWCYDTPGVVQPDQIIHLLTTEELILTLPKSLLTPQTFSMWCNQSIFIGGIARLDYLEGDAILITVYCSESLPITMCKTEDADHLYEKLLGSELLAVPQGSAERLNQWPGLKSSQSTITLKGHSKTVACSDIVLSSAGWVAINAVKTSRFKAWTPEACGIFVRQPLLPHAVLLRGEKMSKGPHYQCDKVFKPIK